MSDTEYVLPAGNDVGASYTVKNLRVALVAKDPVMSQLCVQYQALLLRHNSGWFVEVFESIEAATQWAYSGLNLRQA